MHAMASAVASSIPHAGAVSYGWLGLGLATAPRLSFGADHGGAMAKGDDDPKSVPAASREFIDFEFSLGGSATMLPADELFADGKLLPLRPTQAPAVPEAESAPAAAGIPPPCETTVKTLRASPAVVEAFDPYVFSPKAPTCSSRWRELLRLRKVQTPQKPSASPSPVPPTPSRTSNSSAARSLKLLLLHRNGRAADLSSVAAPLLRDSTDSDSSLFSIASSRFSLSSTSSSCHDHDDFPRHSLDSVDLTPKPRIRLVRSQPHRHPPTAMASPAIAPAASRAAQSPARRRPPAAATTPPPPSVASVDSPRMNSSGKIVFQGLERSSSSPAGSVRSRSRVMDRSYSAPVVLNVPVCSRPSFGFFRDKKDAPGKDAAAARLRSSLGRKTTVGSSSVSCRDLRTTKMQLT